MTTQRESLIPNSTQIPNVLLDHVMPLLTADHERIIRYVCRRTFGFGKKSDGIGLMQFVRGIKKRDGIQLDRGAGVAYSTARGVIEDLEAAGIIQKTSSKTGAPNRYSINLELDPEEAVKRCLASWKTRSMTRRTRGRQARLFDLNDPAGNSQQPVGNSQQGGMSAIASTPPAGYASTTKQRGNKEKQSRAGDAPAPNRFNQYVDWYAELATRARSLPLPLKVTKAGQSNLGRFLREKKPSWELMEQLALYFLAHHSFKKYGPGLETFLSSGIMNGLLNAARNDANFWKDIDALADRYLRRADKSPAYVVTDMQAAVRAMIANMTAPTL